MNGKLFHYSFRILRPELVTLIDLVDVDDSFADGNLESDNVNENVGSEKVNGNSSSSNSYDNSEK